MPRTAKSSVSAGQSLSGTDTAVENNTAETAVSKTSKGSKKSPRQKKKELAVTGIRTTGIKRNQSKFDWDTIMTTFIEGLVIGSSDNEPKLMTLKELSDHYSVPYQTVRVKAASERWLERKADFQARAARDRQKKRIAKLSDQALSFDENSLSAAKLGTTLVIQRLAEVTREVQSATVRRNNALERMANGEAVERWELYPAVNYRELDGLSKSLAMFQQVGQRALGTDIQKHEISGANGGPIELDVETTIDIKTEMLRDDPHRIAQLLMALQQSNLLPVGIEDIVDAELVEDDEDPEDSDTDDD